jgi:hypothetical protein
MRFDCGRRPALLKRSGAGCLAFLLSLPSSGTVQAQMADLTRATCAQLMDLPRNDRAQLIVWLHGYYAGAAQRAVLDRTKLEDSLAAVQELCDRNRATPLIGSETRSVFLGETPPAAPAPPSPAASAPPLSPGAPSR